MPIQITDDKQKIKDKKQKIEDAKEKVHNDQNLNQKERDALLVEIHDMLRELRGA